MLSQKVFNISKSMLGPVKSFTYNVERTVFAVEVTYKQLDDLLLLEQYWGKYISTFINLQNDSVRLYLYFPHEKITDLNQQAAGKTVLV